MTQRDDAPKYDRQHIDSEFCHVSKRLEEVGGKALGDRAESQANGDWGHIVSDIGRALRESPGDLGSYFSIASQAYVAFMDTALSKAGVTGAIAEKEKEHWRGRAKEQCSVEVASHMPTELPTKR